jgi:hypothetical protein
VSEADDRKNEGSLTGETGSGRVFRYRIGEERDLRHLLFMFVAPLEGWKRAEITEQRMRKDRAEIELNVINNHGLSARIPTIEQMREEVAAWNQQRDREASKIDWHFTIVDARIKLKRLYQKFESCLDTSIQT